MAQFVIILLLISLCSFSHARTTLNNPISESGQNATWHTQTCSDDGMLMCLTGISNYVLDGKRYDSIFHYGKLSELKPELLTLDPDPAPGTTIELSPFPILADAAGYIYANWNLDFLLQNSAIRATFANSDLSHISDHLINMSTLRWDERSDTWLFSENHAHNLTIYGDQGPLSVPYYMDGDSGYFITPDFNYANREQFWVVTEVTNVPLPATAWLFASALFGLFIQRRRQR